MSTSEFAQPINWGQACNSAILANRTGAWLVSQPRELQNCGPDPKVNQL